LDNYQKLGLVEVFTDSDTGQEERRFGSIYKSSALDIFGQLELKNPGNDSFSVNLETGDYLPNEAPDNRACSFWFLR